jgi:hypothetical protein
MTTSRPLHALLAAALFAAAVLAASDSLAQLARKPPTPSLSQSLTGTTWILTNNEMTDPKGQRRTLVMGKDIEGQLILGGNGHYSYMVIGDMPKLAKDRIDTTPREDKLISQSVLTHFGTYKIDDTERIITFKVERSSYPNQNGTEAKRAITLKGDQLIIDNPRRTTGGKTTVTFKKG